MSPKEASSIDFQLYLGVVVVVIIWELDLQLPMQSVPITSYVVSSYPAQAIQH
jgi:hypothetical protein